MTICKESITFNVHIDVSIVDLLLGSLNFKFKIFSLFSNYIIEMHYHQDLATALIITKSFFEFTRRFIDCTSIQVHRFPQEFHNIYRYFKVIAITLSMIHGATKTDGGQLLILNICKHYETLAENYRNLLLYIKLIKAYETVLKLLKQS